MLVILTLSAIPQLIPNSPHQELFFVKDKSGLQFFFLWKGLSGTVTVKIESHLKFFFLWEGLTGTDTVKIESHLKFFSFGKD